MIWNLGSTISLILNIFLLTHCQSIQKKEPLMNDPNQTFTNNLINEKSPYLLQHAHNPVNWYPWSDEAFKKARTENKPIFLSIGYSTCHWCHVMEHESFEDIDVAKLMNEAFISIKVDREERPDIDNIYMSVCQMLTGSGGWPLTVIMTPDQKPFFAGTYFPKHTRGNRIGMMELIPKIQNAWMTQKDEIYKSADEITNRISAQFVSSKESISEDIFDKAFKDFENRYDEKYGGFGDRPKFPSPHNLSFLLGYNEKSKLQKPLDMATKTLIEMRKGGIFDHIGYGFHRYSTDKKWFLPHFEKMLYDQAMLTIAYADGYQQTKNSIFKKTVDEILTYILRDMVSPNGGFYSAEDADSEGEEGKFYLWHKNEILKLLGNEDGELLSKLYNVDKNGNYFEEATGHQTGTNHLYLSEEPNLELLNKLNPKREILFAEREKRIHPYKDDKILTDWNGLMIAALAKAGRITNNKLYIESAKKSVNFIYSNLVNEQSQLQHRFRDSEAAISAQIDDYSFLIWGLLELYETTFDENYLEKAIELTDFLLLKFWDNDNNSGFYFTSSDNSNLIARPKEFYDGAIPSGNSVMFSNLLKLSKLTANSNYTDYAHKLELAFKQFVDRAPTGFSQFLTGLLFSHGPSFEIIIAGERESNETTEILNAINSIYLPNKVVMLITERNKDKLLRIAPFIKDYSKIDERTTVYVCKNYVCNLPTNDKNKVLELLKN